MAEKGDSKIIMDDIISTRRKDGKEEELANSFNGVIEETQHAIFESFASLDDNELEDCFGMSVDAAISEIESGRGTQLLTQARKLSEQNQAKRQASLSRLPQIAEDANDEHEEKEDIPKDVPKKTENNSVTKPSRPLSAYNLFFQLQRERMIDGEPSDLSFTAKDVERVAIQRRQSLQDKSKRKHRRSHGKISFAELARIIAGKWKTLDADAKDILKERAAIEKAQYLRQLEEWTKRNGNEGAKTSSTEITGESDVNASALLAEEEPIVRNDPIRPKRELNRSPGGTILINEDPFVKALRESEEELAGIKLDSQDTTWQQPSSNNYNTQLPEQQNHATLNSWPVNDNTEHNHLCSLPSGMQQQKSQLFFMTDGSQTFSNSICDTLNGWPVQAPMAQEIFSPDGMVQHPNKLQQTAVRRPASSVSSFNDCMREDSKRFRFSDMPAGMQYPMAQSGFELYGASNTCGGNDFSTGSVAAQFQGMNVCDTGNFITPPPPPPPPLSFQPAKPIFQLQQQNNSFVAGRHYSFPGPPRQYQHQFFAAGKKSKSKKSATDSLLFSPRRQRRSHKRGVTTINQKNEISFSPESQRETVTIEEENQMAILLARYDEEYRSEQLQQLHHQQQHHLDETNSVKTK